jgi:hypothetical protein
MNRLLVISLFVLSSVLAYTLALKILGLNPSSLRRAVGTFFECLGVFALFLVLNVVLGVTFVLLTRGLTNYFVSMYPLGDSTLVFLSAVQGFVFQLWWRD